VWGGRDVPSQLPAQASRLYAANVTELVLLMTREARVVPDLDDEIVAGCCVTHAGEVRHGPTRELLEG
jgi:NAD(P) transhydrogenase subunit alpha